MAKNKKVIVNQKGDFEYKMTKEMADAYNKFTSERKERMDKVMEQHKAIAEEEKGLDIFKGVINGMNKEEAEKKYAEFEKQQQAAVAGGR